MVFGVARPTVTKSSPSPPPSVIASLSGLLPSSHAAVLLPPRPGDSVLLASPCPAAPPGDSAISTYVLANNASSSNLQPSFRRSYFFKSIQNFSHKDCSDLFRKPLLLTTYLVFVLVRTRSVFVSTLSSCSSQGKLS